MKRKRKSVHKETTIQDGDSQVSTTIDIGQRLGCLHRPDRCLPTHSDSSLIQEAPSVLVRRSGLPVHGLTFWNVPSLWIFTKLMDVTAAHLRQHAISLFPYLDDWLIRDLICNRLVSHTIYCLQTVQNLGLIPNLKKSDLIPAQKFTFIGMEFLTTEWALDQSVANSIFQISIFPM